MEAKNNITDRILTVEEIDELLATVDEVDDEEEVEEDAEHKKKVEETRMERRVLLNLFGEVTEALKAWFGRELKYVKLHSLDIMSYADFLMSSIELSEYYIAINNENINTNIILSIDESILIGLNGDPTLDEKTEISNINELRIVEAIVSFLKENKIANNTTIVKEDRNFEMKHFSEDKEGIVLLYELIPNACTRSGTVMIFVPSELIRPKFNIAKYNSSEKLTLTTKLGGDMINKKIKTLMATAELWAQESYCKRKQVGAVLAKDDRILATGYNGTISGLPNKCEDKFITCPKCKTKYTHNDSVKDKNDVYRIHCKCGAILSYNMDHYSEIEPETNEFTLHAEQNVITFCAKNGIPTAGTEMFVTLSPCKTCAKLIAQAGIEKVYYKDEYKDTSGIEFLKKAGIKIEKI